MLKPSYAELMEILNKDTEEFSEITSRYTIVIAAAKRARQIIAGDEPMVETKQGKPLSTAVDEIYQGKIKVVPEGEGTVINIKKPFNEDEYLQMEEMFANRENVSENNGFAAKSSFTDKSSFADDSDFSESPVFDDISYNSDFSENGFDKSDKALDSYKDISYNNEDDLISDGYDSKICAPEDIDISYDNEDDLISDGYIPETYVPEDDIESEHIAKTVSEATAFIANTDISSEDRPVKANIIKLENKQKDTKIK